MKEHHSPIQGNTTVPWEPLGQIDPGDLPSPSDTYPGPWSTRHRGNGHVDVMDSMDRVFAHVYCYNDSDWDALSAKIDASSAPR